MKFFPLLHPKISTKGFAIITLAFLTSSCASVGPTYLKNDRFNYNSSLIHSDEEQLILNLARMRYGDRPYFISVDNINGQMSLAMGLNSIGQVAGVAPGSLSVPTYFTNLAAQGPQYTDRPTISYSPLQGEKFTRQILSSVSLKDISLLEQSGWSLARIFTMAVQSIGNLENAESAARPDSDNAPAYKEFNSFVHLIRDLQVENKVYVANGKYGDAPSLDIVVKPNAVSNSKVKEMFALAHITNSDNIIRIVQIDARQEEGSNILPIRLRSMMGVLYFLSKGVAVTQEDIQSGAALLAKNPDGSTFSWSNILRGIIDVKSQITRPTHSTASAYYRQRWFYIDDSDHESKKTIALVSQLFSLRSGEVQERGPLKTLNLN